jgi:hypothetical protein
MGTRWRLLLAFVGGLVVGGASFGTLVAWHWNRNFESWYVLQVGDQAHVANEILAGRGMALAERIQASLPASVRAVQGEFANAEGADWALWLVSDVYKTAGTAPPAELQAVFASLPPRATCKKPSNNRGAGDAPR